MRMSIYIYIYIYTSVQPGVSTPIEVQQHCRSSPKRACLAETLPTPTQPTNTANQQPTKQPTKPFESASRPVQSKSQVAFCRGAVCNVKRSGKAPFEHGFATNSLQSSSHGTRQVPKRRIQERPETSKKNLQFAVRHDVAVQSGSTKHPAAKNIKSECHGGLSRPPEELQEMPGRGRKWPEAGAVQRLIRSCCAKQVQEDPCSQKQRFCMPRWAQQASQGVPREAR